MCSILKETCQAIWRRIILRLQHHHQNGWKSVVNLGVFGIFLIVLEPSTVSIIIVIQAPKNSGSTYFNYKGSHSIVLLAVCDAHYRFILVDIGEVGRRSDGGVLSNSAFGQAMEEGTFSLPRPSPLPGTTQPDLPFAFVGDEAFPLRSYMLRPYPGRNWPEERAVFNYRLSRARRIIENSFGILASRWRFLRRPIIANPVRVVIYTQAAVALHNFLRTVESSVYCPPGYVDAEDWCGNVMEGIWRRDDDNTGMQPILQTGSNRYSRSAACTRDLYKDYFCSSTGKVEWQYQHVRRTN